MIVSHEHRFIFVRNRKTASTSVEILLSRYVGPGDVVTALCERDEGLRRRYGGLGPQNHRWPGWPAAGPTPPGPGPGIRFYNHMPVAEIRALVGERVWRSYFTFCFERNPWDKVVSLYYHRYRQAPRPGLAQFVRSAEASDAYNWPLYTERDQPAVDVVGKYENLATEFPQILRRLGLPTSEALPRAKAHFRPPVEQGEVLDAESVSRVAELYAKEIEYHGYQAPGPRRTVIGAGR